MWGASRTITDPGVRRALSNSTYYYRSLEETDMQLFTPLIHKVLADDDFAIHMTEQHRLKEANVQAVTCFDDKKMWHIESTEEVYRYLELLRQRSRSYFTITQTRHDPRLFHYAGLMAPAFSFSFAGVPYIVITYNSRSNSRKAIGGNLAALITSHDLAAAGAATLAGRRGAVKFTISTTTPNATGVVSGDRGAKNFATSCIRSWEDGGLDTIWAIIRPLFDESKDELEVTVEEAGLSGGAGGTAAVETVTTGGRRTSWLQRRSDCFMM